MGYKHVSVLMHTGVHVYMYYCQVAQYLILSETLWPGFIHFLKLKCLMKYLGA